MPRRISRSDARASNAGVAGASRHRERKAPRASSQRHFRQLPRGPHAAGGRRQLCLSGAVHRLDRSGGALGVAQLRHGRGSPPVPLAVNDVLARHTALDQRCNRSRTPAPGGSLLTLRKGNTDLLLQFRGVTGAVPTITNPAGTARHGPTKITVTAGSRA